MTTTRAETMQRVMNAADPNEIADGMRKMKVGNMAAVVKVTAAALTAAASIDITTAAVKAASTIAGIALDTGENLPAIGNIVSLRVTTSGTANSVGTYAITDDAGDAVSPTASTVTGIAALSDDGKTIEFPTTVTGFVLVYQPRSAVAMTEDFAD